MFVTISNLKKKFLIYNSLIFKFQHFHLSGAELSWQEKKHMQTVQYTLMVEVSTENMLLICSGGRRNNC